MSITQSAATLQPIDPRSLRTIIELHHKYKTMKLGGQLANLAYIDLSGVNLEGMDLSDAVLTGACLRGAALRDVNLSRANLYGCDLREADLRFAVLDRADMRGGLFARSQSHRGQLDTL